MRESARWVRDRGGLCRAAFGRFVAALPSYAWRVWPEVGRRAIAGSGRRVLAGTGCRVAAAGVVVAAAFTTSPYPLAAQASHPAGSPPAPAPASWTTAWSPLAPLADLSFSSPDPPGLPGLLLGPAPRTGLLWSAGSPAGVAFEVDRARGELSLGAGVADGAYRGPLDEDGLREVRLDGLRWQRLGGSGAVVGRVSAASSISDGGSFTGAPLRHGGDPFLVTDTTTPGMRHVRARLEGAYGWRRSGWAVGVGAGLEVQDDRTRAARLPRLGRSSTPAVSLGLARSFGDGRLTLSAHGRWVGGHDNLRVVALAADGVVYRLQGYSDPEPARFTNRIFGSYLERDARAGGMAVAGEEAGVSWVAFGEITRREHRHTRALRDDAPVDRWEADGWRAGAALGGRLFGGRLDAAARGTFTRVDGDAYRSDLQGSIHRSSASRLDAVLHLRWTPRDGSWRLGSRLAVERSAEVRSDFLAEVASDVVAWRPQVAVEAARRVGGETWLSVGGGVAFRNAVSMLPDPEALGPVYTRIGGAGLALQAAAVRPLALEAALRHPLSEGVDLLVRAGGSWVAGPGDGGSGTGGGASTTGGGGSSNAGAVPLLPGGERTTAFVSVGVVWGGGGGS